MSSTIVRTVGTTGMARLLIALALLLCTATTSAQDLADIKARGTLRHLGVLYANFVTGGGDGMDVELARMFAQHLGVRYEYVETDWSNVLADLIGHNIKYDPTPQTTGSRPIRGDMIATGLTVLPARTKLIDYSQPTFPSAIWLLARAEFDVTPIKPTGDIGKDIDATKAKLAAGSTFVSHNGCIDPRLYGLEGKGYRLVEFTYSSNLNDIVPILLQGKTDMTLLDFPDILVALDKWPARIKIIGPISDEQKMAAAFRKSSPALREAFNDFLAQIKRDGTYMKLVRKYYPSAPRYMPGFFSDATDKP
jgi:ABC-type amino acid transport substrate-binding protein